MTRSWQDALGVPHPPTDTVAAVPQTGLSPSTTASAFFGVVDRLPAAQASFLNAGPGEEVIPRLSLDPTGSTQSVWVCYIVGSLGSTRRSGTSGWVRRMFRLLSTLRRE